MKKYEVFVSTEPYIDSLEDFRDITIYELKGEKHIRAALVEEENIIVLDPNGKDYLLTICWVEYGGAGPEDCFEDLHWIIKANEQQVEKLKALTGQLGRDSVVAYEKIKESLSFTPQCESILQRIENSGLIADWYNAIYGFLSEFKVSERKPTFSNGRAKKPALAHFFETIKQKPLSM